MITVFWACERVIPVDTMPRGETSQSYINVLTEHRKHFKRIQPHKNLTQILLQHDDARPPTSLKTSEAIIKCGWILLPPPTLQPRSGMLVFPPVWSPEAHNPQYEV